MRAITTLMLCGLFACGAVDPSQQTGNLHEPDAYGDYDKYSVRPAGDAAPGLAFLGSVAHAGNFESRSGDTVRVFELYEDGRIEVAIAIQADHRSTVYNLTDRIGIGIDEIESITQPSADELDLWIYEEGAEWAMYKVELGDRRGQLEVERWVYGDYVDPESPGAPKSKTALAIHASSDARYSALPRLTKLSVINFEAPTLGSARIFQLDTDGNSQIVVSLRIGNDPERVYDTKAVVKDVLASAEIEPGYFDILTDPLCPPPGGGCGTPFDTIAIDFELSPDGRSLASDTIVVHLKYGVG